MHRRMLFWWWGQAATHERFPGKSRARDAAGSFLDQVQEVLWGIVSSYRHGFRFIRLMKPGNASLSRKWSGRISIPPGLEVHILFHSCGVALPLGWSIHRLQILWPRGRNVSTLSYKFGLISLNYPMCWKTGHRCWRNDGNTLSLVKPAQALLRLCRKGLFSTADGDVVFFVCFRAPSTQWMGSTSPPWPLL